MRRAQSAIFLFISFLFPSTRCAHHACSNLMYGCFHSNIHALRVFLVCISWIRVVVAVAVAVTEIAYRYFKKRACMQHCAQSHIASMVSTFANFGRGRRPHFATCGDSSNLLTISTVCCHFYFRPARRGARGPRRPPAARGMAAGTLSAMRPK